MPTVVKTQPTGAFTTAPRSIGAVIFDRPQYDPQTIALKVADDLDAWGKRKQAEAEKKKADSAKLVADLNFDDKGAFPDDAEYFKKGKEELINSQIGLSRAESDTPQWNDTRRKAELTKGWYESDVNESAKQWEQYKDSWAKFNPEKHDQQKFNEWNAKVRMARSPRERMDLFKESPLVDRVGDFQTMLGERMSKGLYKPTVVEKSAPDTIKGTVIESTEKYTDDDIIRNASAIVNGDADMVESARKGLEQLKSRSSLLYDQVVEDAKQAGIDPLEMFTRKQLRNSVNSKFELKSPAWSPEQQQAAEYNWGKKDTEGMVNFVVEQGGNLLNGKPESYTIGGEMVSGGAQLTPETSVTFAGQTPLKSDQFQGWSMGKYTVTETTGEGDNAVSKIVPKDNYVIAWEWRDGKPYIKTDETVYAATNGTGVGGKPVDKQGWKEANQTDIERIIISNVAPAKAQEAVERYREKLQKEKAYKERTARPQEMEGQTKKTVVETPLKVEVKRDGQKPAEQKKEDGKEGKTVSRQTIKSKVGTKGFEGYTEKELIDYYTSQGYTIK